MSAVQIAWRAHPDFPLVLLFNRTEAHARASEPAAWWGAPHDVLGGRDLRSQGTWFAVGRCDGRFALVTGYREAQAGPESPPSRGELPLQYLAGDDTPVGFTRRFMRDKGPYAPFNLIVGSPRQAHYAATRSRLPLALTEGLHTLSTGLLDQRMAPTERLGTLFGAYIKAYGGFTTLLDGYPRLRDAQALVGCELPAPEATLEARDIAAAAFVMLADRHVSAAADASTPDRPDERRRSAVFVTGGDFGTRSSTVFIMGRDGGLYFEERSFDADGALSHRVLEQWRQDPSVFGAPGD
jgi:uncharacterized protein with NRDE domain